MWFSIVILLNFVVFYFFLPVCVGDFHKIEKKKAMAFYRHDLNFYWSFPFYTRSRLCLFLTFYIFDVFALKETFPLIIQLPVRDDAVNILIAAGLNKHRLAELGIVG